MMNGEVQANLAGARGGMLLLAILLGLTGCGVRGPEEPTADARKKLRRRARRRRKWR